MRRGHERVRLLEPHPAGRRIASGHQQSTCSRRRPPFTCHGLGMRCGLGSLVHISELNSAIAFLRQLNYERKPSARCFTCTLCQRVHGQLNYERKLSASCFTPCPGQTRSPNQMLRTASPLGSGQMKGSKIKFTRCSRGWVHHAGLMQVWIA